MSVTSTATTRRTIQLPIDDGVVGLRGLSPQRHRFELEYALERGSTANSVIFEAGDGAPAVLVHPPGVAYSAAFLPVLAEPCPAATHRCWWWWATSTPTVLPCCGIWRRPMPASN